MVNQSRIALVAFLTIMVSNVWAQNSGPIEITIINPNRGSSKHEGVTPSNPVPPLHAAHPADEVRAQVVQALKQGNVAAAKSRFVPGRNDDIFATLDRSWMNILADWIEKAKLLEQAEAYRVYQGAWTDDAGVTRTTKFWMLRDESRQWRIQW